MKMLLASALLLVLAAGFPAAGVRAAEKVAVSLGTATPGGGFPVYGDAVAATINEIEPALDVRPQNTKGSGENVPLLEQGRLDIALVQGEAAMVALSGVGRAPADLRILFAMYATPGMFVVRADSPYRSIGDLKGQPVAFGARSSGLVLLARYVLEGMGLDQTQDFQAIFLDRAGDGPSMVQDGRAAALWGGGTGWPGFTAMANSPGGARFIVPTAEDIARIQAKHPFLQTLPVPAGSFRGQTEALTSVGSWSFILARPTLPNDVAYKLARALHRGEAALAQRLPQARETTAANTAHAARHDMLHPGVRRYLAETGLLRAHRH